MISLKRTLFDAALRAAPQGVLLGLLGRWLGRQRMFWLGFAAAVAYLQVVFVAMVSQSNSGWPRGDDIGFFLLGACWVAIAYGPISAPVLVGVVVMLERWTRPRGDTSAASAA